MVRRGVTLGKEVQVLQLWALEKRCGRVPGHTLRLSRSAPTCVSGHHLDRDLIAGARWVGA